MKCASLASMIAASEGKFDDLRPRGRLRSIFLALLAGAIASLSAAYFVAREKISSVEKQKDSAVAAMGSVYSEKKRIEAELGAYRTKDEQNRSALADANASVLKYRRDVEELENSVKRLTDYVDAHKGSVKERDSAIDNLANRLSAAEQQAKGLLEKVAEYEKSAGNAAEEARQKDRRAAGLQDSINELQKQAAALGEECEKYKALAEDERKKYMALAEDERKKYAIAVETLTEYAKKVSEISLKLGKMSKAGRLVFVKGKHGLDEFLPERELDAYKELLDRISRNSRAFFGTSYKGSYAMQPEKDCFEQMPYNHITEIRITGGPCIGRSSGFVSLGDLAERIPYVEVLHIESACVDSAFGFEKFPALRELNLVNCNVECLSGFEKVPNLKELVLAGNVGFWNTEENTKYLGILAGKGVKVILEAEDYQNWAESKR